MVRLKERCFFRMLLNKNNKISGNSGNTKSNVFFFLRIETRENIFPRIVSL